MVDPVDETSGLIDTPVRLFQSTSIIIATPEGAISAAAIASLVDPRIMILEKDRVGYVMYEEQTGLLNPYQPNSSPWNREDGVVVATLPRRIPSLSQLPLFTDPSIHTTIVPTFGGYGILDMFAPLGKPVDAMIDITRGKGQPWYELWGAIAQKAGGVARGISGKDLSFNRLIRFAASHEMDSTKRIPTLIARNREIYDFVGPKLGILPR